MGQLDAAKIAIITIFDILLIRNIYRKKRFLTRHCLWSETSAIDRGGGGGLTGTGEGGQKPTNYLVN